MRTDARRFKYSGSKLGNDDDDEKYLFDFFFLSLFCLAVLPLPELLPAAEMLPWPPVLPPLPFPPGIAVRTNFSIDSPHT